MQGFQRICKELETLGARVAGASTDTWAAQGAFKKENGLEFPLLSDWPGNKTVQAFGVLREGASVASRATFVFDAEGVLRAVVDDQRNMQAHPDGALAAVRELAARR